MNAPRPPGAIAIVAMGIVGGCAAPAPLAPPPPSDARVVVHVRGVPGDEGRVIVGLCADPSRWLTEGGYDFGATAPAQRDEIVVTVEGVSPGRYALSIFHDANGNARLDRGAFGLPTEAWGFANNPRTLGPASFQQAAIDVVAPETTVEITLRPPLRP